MKKIWLSFWDAFEVFFFGAIDHPGLAMIRLILWIAIIVLVLRFLSKVFWFLVSGSQKTHVDKEFKTPDPKLPKAVLRYVGSTGTGDVIDTLEKEPWEHRELKADQVEIHALNPEHALSKLNQYINDLNNGCDPKITI